MTPYIHPDARATACTEPDTAGELNYKLAGAIDDYLIQREPSYRALNEVVGVLECLKLEVYRRLAAPYEDKKCDENGDVFVCADSYDPMIYTPEPGVRLPTVPGTPAHWLDQHPQPEAPSFERTLAKVFHQEEPVPSLFDQEDLPERPEISE